jgi:ABC-2 type transport system permease protein
MTNRVPSSTSALLTLAGVTLLRFSRGKAVWVVVAIAALPLLFGAAIRDDDPVTVVEMLVMGLLPPVFVASAIAEELEERTSTYLWSRPLPRWTLLIGKLLALAPIAAVLIALGWVVAMQVATGAPPSARSTLAFAVGALAISAMSAGIGTLVPKHGMALSIVYFVVIDLAVGAIPASVQSISITHHVRQLGGLDDPGTITESAITLVVLAAIWLAVGLWRVRRLES